MGAGTRQPYDDVVATAPVTVPYERYSIRSAHWFLGRSLAELLSRSGLAKDDVDGVCVSSFTLPPDNAIGLMQYLGMSPRWLDAISLGGACGVVALRRAARAVQSGDAGGRRVHRGRHQPRPLLPSQRLRTSASSRATRCIPMARAARTRASRSSPTTTCGTTAPRARTSASSASPSARTRSVSRTRS